MKSVNKIILAFLLLSISLAIILTYDTFYIPITPVKDAVDNSKYTETKHFKFLLPSGWNMSVSGKVLTLSPIGLAEPYVKITIIEPENDLQNFADDFKTKNSGSNLEIAHFNNIEYMATQYSTLGYEQSALFTHQKDIDVQINIQGNDHLNDKNINIILNSLSVKDPDQRE